MSDKIIIPIIVDLDTKKEVDEDVVTVEPASISKKLKDAMNKSISFLGIDEITLTQCIKSSITLVNSLKKTTESQNSLTPDTLSIQLGITSSGAVGFLGSGMELKIAAIVQVTFKIQ